MNSNSFTENLESGKLVLVDSKAIFPKTSHSVAFKAAKWKDSGCVVEEWVMCIKCDTWLNVPKSHGTNDLKRHLDKCRYGYAVLSSADLATLVANCLRLGGFKVKTNDIKMSIDGYAMINKDSM